MSHYWDHHSYRYHNKHVDWATTRAGIRMWFTALFWIWIGINVIHFIVPILIGTAMLALLAVVGRRDVATDARLPSLNP